MERENKDIHPPFHKVASAHSFFLKSNVTKFDKCFEKISTKIIQNKYNMKVYLVIYVVI